MIATEACAIRGEASAPSKIRPSHLERLAVVYVRQSSPHQVLEHRELQSEQAEAEKQAAMARAREAEMQALVEENRAKVVENEAKVPLAIAEAFRSGNLGTTDFYPMRNVEADTSMRGAIGGTGERKAEPPRA